MAPKYTLTYFNGRGMAEVCRLILVEAGVDYVDERLDKEKDWPARKPTTPFGKVPTLSFDGHVISESRAIARYLAREHGLAGKNNLEAAICDMLVDASYDFLSGVRAVLVEKDEQKKNELLAKFALEVLPPAFASYKKILEKNKGGKGFIVGDNLTWADIALTHALWGIHNRHPHFVDEHPVLKEYMERVINRPKIKAWIEKRPKTEF